MCCKKSDVTDSQGSSVEVKVDVPKIVKYSCIAAVMIIAIIFGTKTFIKMLEINKK